MALTGEEVRANLTRFVARWSVRDGYEKGEAHLFLGDLFACYGQDLAEVATFEQFQDGGFIDLIWPRVCIFEMKSAGEAKRLDRHRDAEVCPSNLTNVFAFDDDYSMGVLTSSIHGAWAHSESSTLEDRPRYTPTSCFEAFPWPQSEEVVRTEVSEIAKSLIERRQAVCVENEIGLTVLYNRVEEGAWSEIADLHRALDEAVARAYGWPVTVAQDPIEAKVLLATLHRQVRSGLPYDPFFSDTT